ncbi:hypothetical protein IH781_01075 [Patescibacteria group bacterium]|nr:hypothetical protein [Patescibacteria group bacterium]
MTEYNEVKDDAELVHDYEVEPDDKKRTGAEAMTFTEDELGIMLHSVNAYIWQLEPSEYTDKRNSEGLRHDLRPLREKLKKELKALNE